MAVFLQIGNDGGVNIIDGTMTGEPKRLKRHSNRYGGESRKMKKGKHSEIAFLKQQRGSRFRKLKKLTLTEQIADLHQRS